MLLCRRLLKMLGALTAASLRSVLGTTIWFGQVRVECALRVAYQT